MDNQMDTAREDKLIPVAMSVLEILTDKGIIIGTKAKSDFEATSAAYAPLKEKIGSLFLEQDIKLADVSFVFALVRQALEITESKVSDMLNDAIRRAETKLWGCSNMDITMTLLDKTAKQ